MDIERTATGPHRGLFVRINEHTPANKRHGQVKASAELDASLNTRDGGLLLHATEFVEGHKGTRRNMVWLALREPQARALYDLLASHFDTSRLYAPPVGGE